MTRSFVDIWMAEADRAIQAASERMAQDLFRSDPTVKIYSEGAVNAEPTWIGTCSKCRYRYVTNLHWPTRSKMPDRCDRPDTRAFMGGVLCGGEVEHDPVMVLIWLYPVVLWAACWLGWRSGQP